MNNGQRLDESELVYAKKLVSSSHAFMWICLAFLIPVSVAIRYPAIIVIVVAVSVSLLLLIWWPFRYVSVDYKVGQKTVEKTTIERLQKVGFFEMQADSALGIMAGAIYYLWLPDETRSPPHRRFRIGLTTYRQLMLYGSGSPIEISYLPKSGMILSIDVPGYRYAAYESLQERHKID